MNDKEVKKMLENEPVPEELKPENIKAMLDEKAPAARRKKITAVSRFTAIAAACAVVSGTAVYVAGHGNNINKDKNTVSVSGTSKTATDAPATVAANIPENQADPAPVAYMCGAEDYSQIYELMRAAAEKQENSKLKNSGRGIYFGGAVPETNGLSGVKTVQEADYSANGDDSEGGMKGNTDHSDTFDQEEGVLESDIVKTDGRYIYKLNAGGTYDYSSIDGVDEITMVKGHKRVMPSVGIVEVKDGEFGEKSVIDLSGAVNRIEKELVGGTKDADVYADQMYLYNDMIVVIGNISKWDDDYTNYSRKTFAAVYSAKSHDLIDTYVQDGYFNDVRITPDGYLYLISDYSTQDYSKITDKNDYIRFIPSAGLVDDFGFVEPADILMPEGTLQPGYSLSYTIISSLDLNTSGSVRVAENKALAGYSGEIYCSADNLYTAAYDYGKDLPEDVAYGFTTNKTTDTVLTRIAIGGGQITPAASGKIAGVVNDQFSMSEYNGYFRVATTCNEYTLTYTKGEYYDYDTYYDTDDPENLPEPEKHEYGYFDYSSVKQDNRVYVLDLDMNLVGSIGDFGIDESVKSVNFNGDMAYVVTYEQTDPLFAIDLSDPAAPKILDEYKILGYSTYMQRWSDDLLIGFGPDADSDGVETGVKLVMFDNSDPNELKEVGKVALNRNRNDYQGIWSTATYDRKALLIDPEKNLIAFPTTEYSYDPYDYSDSQTESYRFYSYEDGKFVHKGDFSTPSENYTNELVRALYISDWVYVVSDSNEIYSIDLNSNMQTEKAVCRF